MKINFVRLFLAPLLVLVILAGCATSPTVKADPTALPYTPVTIEPLEISKGDATQGEAVYGEYCANCHSIEEAVTLTGPSFFAAGKRLQFAYIKDSIVNPHAANAVPDSIEYMPEEIGEQLEPEQLYDVIAYIRTLK